jgi:hypothetical protein
MWAPDAQGEKEWLRLRSKLDEPFDREVCNAAASSYSLLTGAKRVFRVGRHLFLLESHPCSKPDHPARIDRGTIPRG